MQLESQYHNIDVKNIIGFTFNNELYYQMAKGLIHPDMLEWISNQHLLGTVIIAPSMYIKQIWDEDPDYKFYKDQIFTNLHETHSNNEKSLMLLENFISDNGMTMPETKISPNQSKVSFLFPII